MSGSIRGCIQSSGKGNTEHMGEILTNFYEANVTFSQGTEDKRCLSSTTRQWSRTSKLIITYGTY